ncbi:MAG: hypothetical protein ABSH51_22705 [Solirubrobacteraceae bacterium]|jgi:hypothetical protein
MTAANILLYIALIGFVLFKKVQGQPIKAPTGSLGLPIILIVLGFGDLTGATTMKPVEIAVTAVGAVLSLGLGLMRGRADKLSTRDGVPFVQWGTASLALFAGNIVAKLVLDIVGVAAGGNASAVGQSLLFTLGLTLLGEALIVLMRSSPAAASLNPRSATGGQASDSRSELAPTRQRHAHSLDEHVPAPNPAHRYEAIDRPRQSADQAAQDLTNIPPQAASLVNAIAQHHSDHTTRHARRHDRYRS